MRNPKIVGTATELKDHRDKKTGTIKATIAGFEAHAKTVEDAEMEIYLQMQRMSERSPEIVHYRGHTAMLYPLPEGWYYSTIRPDDFSEYPVQYLGSSSLCESYEDSLDALLYILAQRAWQYEDGPDVPSIFSKYRTRDKQAREWKSWVDFQMRFREAIDSGMDRDAAHNYATRSPVHSFEDLPATIQRMEKYNALLQPA